MKNLKMVYIKKILKNYNKTLILNPRDLLE